MILRILIIICLTLMPLAAARAAEAPAGESSTFQVTLEAFSGGSIVAESSAFMLDHVVGGLNSLSTLKSKSFNLEIGIGDSLSGVLGMTVLGITPASGNNIASIHINKIEGLNFISGVDVRLTLTGENDIIADNITVIDVNNIECDFNITGSKPGLWTVLVSKEADSDTLPNAFEIKTYTFPQSVAINYPNPFDPETQETTIYYNLAKDADVEVYIFTMNADLVWKQSFRSAVMGGKKGENRINWNGISYFNNLLSTGTYFLHVVEKATGQTLAKAKIVIIRR